MNKRRVTIADFVGDIIRTNADYIVEPVPHLRPIPVVLVSGYARAGKNTFAEGMIRKARKFDGLLIETSFAAELKSAANAYLEELDTLTPSTDFFEESFKNKYRNALVELGRMSRDIDKDIFAKRVANRILDMSDLYGRDVPFVVTDWRYLNEYRFLRDRLEPRGFRVVTVRIDTAGILPSNDEELHSLAEIRRNMAPDKEFVFAPNNRDAIIAEGERFAAELGL
jgi:hypothetical protein